jgi:fibronectin type 3 domain-containing protein
MNLFTLPRAPREFRKTGRVLGGLILAAAIPISAITASAAGPIASSSFVGVENPLSEGGTWVPLTSLWPNTGQLQKNGGAFPNQAGHAGAYNTAPVPADQYSEIVVGHLGNTNSNVGPIVRVQTSGPSVDSHYLWWATQPGGSSNGLYRIDANGSTYAYDFVAATSGAVDGDTLRLIARGPVIYGIKNGVREFIYNPHAASVHYPTGATGVLAYTSDGVVENAKIASWSTGAAPVSSGNWASTNFAGTEDPLDEGDRWYPLPSYDGFRKQDGLAIGKNPSNNAAGAWGITPPATQYSQVTLGTVSGGAGGPIVRIDRTANGQTGWLLLLVAQDPSQSGIYRLSSDASGGPLFTAAQLFPSAPAIVAGDRWRLGADGNTLTVSKNGASQFTYTTDGSYPSGDVGIEAYTTAFTFAGWEGGAALDTQAPTAPSSLTATAASGTQINLAWTASTDNVGVTGYQVERCQGAGCTNFASVTTVTGTTFSNTGLTNGTSYSYRVRATDAAGNPSAYSNVASASTPDTQAPTAPSNVTAKTVTSHRVDLTWTASGDNVGVTGYQIERCQNPDCTNFAPLATATGTTYSDTTVTADNIFRYRVTATDAAGNLSNYSNVATANTDTTSPTAPTALTALGTSSSQVNLLWTESTDNVGVNSYLVERCEGLGCSNFTQVATVAGTSNTYNDKNLKAATVYTYRVRATDFACNLGDYSNTATATTTLALGPGL